MSSREWYSTMYGVKLPNEPVHESVVYDFICMHPEAFGDFFAEGFDKTPADAYEYMEMYMSDEDECGIEAMIADVLAKDSDGWIAATVDEDGDVYIGMFAIEIFPWSENFNKSWYNMTAARVEELVKPVVEELYGRCGDFETHVIWYYG